MHHLLVAKNNASFRSSSTFLDEKSLRLSHPHRSRSTLTWPSTKPSCQVDQQETLVLIMGEEEVDQVHQ